MTTTKRGVLPSAGDDGEAPTGSGRAAVVLGLLGIVCGLVGIVLGVALLG